MSDRLNKLDRDINQAERTWNVAFIHPYGECYEQAYLSFHRVLAEADRQTARNAELAVLAVSVVSGSIFTAIMGSLTVQAVVRNAVLRRVAENNLNATYRRIRDLASHRVTTFAVGKLLDEAKSTLSKKVTEAVGKRSNLLPIRLTDTPGSMRSQLKAMWDMQAIMLTDAADAIEGDGAIGSAEKNRYFAMLYQAALLAGPSATTLDTEKLANKLELTMLMKHLLDLDSLVKYPAYSIMGQSSYSIGSSPRPTSRQPIQAMPGSAGYPQTTYSQQQGIYTMSGRQEVQIERIAPAIVERVDTLHKALFNKTPFFGDTNILSEFISHGTSPADLQKAVSVLDKLRERSQPTESRAIVNV